MMKTVAKAWSLRDTPDGKPGPGARVDRPDLPGAKDVRAPTRYEASDG
jgi:hypothetical protein